MKQTVAFISFLFKFVPSLCTLLCVQMTSEIWRRQLLMSGAITADEVREAVRRFTQVSGPFAIFSVRPPSLHFLHTLTDCSLLLVFYSSREISVILRTDQPTTDLCFWTSLPGRTSNGHIYIMVPVRCMVTVDHL